VTGSKKFTVVRGAFFFDMFDHRVEAVTVTEKIKLKNGSTALELVVMVRGRGGGVQEVESRASCVIYNPGQAHACAEAVAQG
jgi:dTDP-4-dehydrorhamnose 3,5-epimerase-like enzyme